MMTNVSFGRLWLLVLALGPVCGAQAMDQAQEILRLVEELGDDDPHVRKAATDKLIAIGEPALPAVRKAVESDDPEVSQRARSIIRVVEMKIQVGLSDKLLRSMPDIYVQLSKGTSGADLYRVFAEVTMVDRESKKPLHEFDPADAGKLAGLMAARGFSGMRDDEKRDFLRRCRGEVRYPDGGVDSADLNLPATAPHLLPLLKDGNERVREAAAQALGKLGAKEVAHDLLPLLKDGNAGVRWAAAFVLGSLGVKEHAPDLVPLLKDGGMDVRATAAFALGSLGAKEHAPALVPLLKDGEASVRLAAAFALGNLGAKEHAADLVPLLKDGNGWVRRNATYALGKIGTREHAADLVPLLKDGEATVRWTAAWVIGMLGAKEVAPNLVPLLKDEDKAVRWYAAWALGNLGDKEHAHEIVPLLKDENENVRIVAGIALVELGRADDVTPNVVEEIKRIPEINGYPEETRARAARALEKLGVKREEPKKER